MKVLQNKFMPKLSVVVIAYNNELYIEEALESLADQTYSNLEVVVVNDSSTDSTGIIIDKFIKGKPNFKAIHLKENSGGCSVPRNTGISNSTGEYIMFLDGDDWYTKDACEKMVVALNKTDSDFVAGQVIRTNNYEVWYYRQIYSRERLHINIREFPILFFDSLSVNKIYKRSFLNKHNLRFPEGIHYEDIVFTGKAYFLADSVSIIPEPIYYWRVVEDAEVKSITNQRYDFKNLKNRIEAHRQLDDFLKLNNAFLYQSHKNNKFLRHDLKLYTNDYLYYDEDYKEKFHKLIFDYLNEVMDPYAFIILPEKERIMYYLLFMGDREGFEDFIYYKNGFSTKQDRLYNVGKQYYFQTTNSRSNIKCEKFLKLDKVEINYRLEDISLKENEFSFDGIVELNSINQKEFTVLWILKNRQTRESIYGKQLKSNRVVFDITSLNFGNFYLTILINHLGNTHKKIVKFSNIIGDCNIKITSSVSTKRIFVNHKNSLAIQVTPVKLTKKVIWKFKRRKLLKNNDKASIVSSIINYICKRIIEKLPVKKNWILFESHMGKQFSDSPKYIYLELCKKKRRKYKFFWSLEQPDLIDIPGSAKKVKRNSLKHYYYLNRSKYWVDNQGMAHLTKKKSDQVYLQTWHGTPLKKMGYEQKGILEKNEKKKLKLQTRSWDYFISPNPYSTKVFKKAFRYSGEVLEVGYPRNDILKNFSKMTADNIRRKLDIANANKIILFAPTFRDWEPDAFRKIYYDLYKISQCIKDTNTILLIRLHYLLSDKLSNIQLPYNIKNVSSYQDIQELYLITDILITDYSSVMFDFSILNRPIIFYCYDLEEYIARRGTYFNLVNKAPGPICRSINEVLYFINNSEELSKYLEDVKGFRSEFGMLEDGNATSRVISKIFN
ncbi:bifunctional glycosyltransferase/CDP-glycerol:glycerophosphate glycerophosphotransferase [Virgibacillus proomii]|uniref:bifunctional glycosyltransferase/CDP-glycerol:glycerophosphate glycerophosphotransferase n=1 Tax=Virgibacillus proomii TaxID=84407 RepID=UPI001C122F68|nr:bifunctional glycosyltransferase family 2 protein/CDP-glycerol:glycerophosphate glycerophosphotransferase [Virgibacillus proomii]MBU5268068.1 bifunctional glycosyltransferase family 2 protein/CDP-glycerol:glycerophosphate glycerophosphotransferase [Virgibacillus proomii]